MRKRQWKLVRNVVAVCVLCAGMFVTPVQAYETTGHPVLDACAKFEEQLETDRANGMVWKYYNSKCSKTFSDALANSNRRMNCALLARWALKDAGLISSGVSFWGDYNGEIHWGNGAESEVRAVCDVYPIYNQTTKELIANGGLQPGDIVTYENYRHTNVYAGDNMWYDAGHVFCNEGGDGAVFPTWYGEKNDNPKVAYIIRLKSEYVDSPILVEDDGIYVEDISGPTR